MGKKGKGRSAKGARKNMISESEELSKAPHCFVINRSKIGKNPTELMMNIRKVMEPFTASNLKIRKSNCLKDFVSIASGLNVTHMLNFTQTDISLYLKLIRFPRGPTLTFKVDQFSLAKDVVSSQRRPVSYSMLFMHQPLLAFNGFSNESKHQQLMVTMFQNMFPSINVNTVKLNDIRRCVLFNYNTETQQVEFRHYAIKTVPTGISKPVKKLIKKVPDLSRYSEISEYIENPDYLSESEAELDNEDNKVVLSQPIATRGVVSGEKVALRLTELGPRMTLSLIKIEEGVCDGDILYHSIIDKTEEEKNELRERKKKKEKLKLKIQKTQEINRKKKLEDSKNKPNTNSKEDNHEEPVTTKHMKRKRNKDEDKDDEDLPNKKSKISKTNEDSEETELVSFTKSKPKGIAIKRKSHQGSHIKDVSQKKSAQFKKKSTDKSQMTIADELLKQKKNKLKRQKLKDKKLKRKK